MAAGSFSNLYRGYYCGQEVAVKILKELQDDASQFQEFLQEVSIMRKVRQRHKQQGCRCSVTGAGQGHWCLLQTAAGRLSSAWLCGDLVCVYA